MKLYPVPGSQTAAGFAVVWDKVKKGKKPVSYELFVNGTREAVSVQTDYTFEEFAPDMEYQVMVRAITEENDILDESGSVCVRTAKEPEIFNILDYGAVGDGGTMNTKAIQRAIDSCSGGGMVYVPAGIFKSGALFLKSSMTFHVEEGGVLLGSGQAEDYPLINCRYEGREEVCHASLINCGANGEKCHDIAITGKGLINGNGSGLLRSELENGNGRRGSILCLQNTERVYLQDITLRHSPFWCVHLIYCSQIGINRISIHTKYDEEGGRYPEIVNGDGIDPDSCREVLIFHSHICSQDDCIAVKSGRDEEGRRTAIPSENIRITNCSFRSGFGVAMGSEMSGGVRNVLVQDCRFEDSFSIGSIKTRRGRGACIENIVYENCSLTNRDRTVKPTKWFKGALYVDCFYGIEGADVKEEQPVGEGTPLIQKIVFRDISVETKEGYAVYLAGLRESPVRNILLERVSCNASELFYAENVEGLVVNSLHAACQEA